MATALPKTRTMDFKDMALQCEQLKANDGTAVNIVELTALSGTEFTALDGVTPGTVAASKAVIVDSSKDITSFGSLTAVTVNATNVDAGSSGTAGSLDVFPSTASKGKITITAVDNTTDAGPTITNAAMLVARTLTLEDPGASADFAYTGYQRSLIGNTDGGAASTILPGTQSVVLASNNTNTDDWILLPLGVAGTTIKGWHVVAGEIRTPATQNEKINDVDADGGSAELTMPADTFWIAECKVTGEWLLTATTKLGAVVTAIVPSA